MRSQFRFVMHPDDERAFAAYLLAERDVLLIDGPRWSTPQPRPYRALEDVKGNYCIVWSPQDCSALKSRQLPDSNAWYCEDESFIIQFLRSQIFDNVVTEGRLAVSTSGLPSQLGVEKRFKALVRHAKKNYSNATLQWVNPTLPEAGATRGRSANPSKPDTQVWVAPYAMQWLQGSSGRCVKQFTNAVVEARVASAA